MKSAERDWRQMEREMSRSSAHDDFRVRPYLGQISGYDSQNDRIKVSGPTGEPYIALSHPFLSTNSWIRAIPENNSSVWLHSRQDNRRLGMLGYNSDILGNRLRDFQNGVGVYRPLSQGEIEFTSFGIAGLCGKRDGTLELRGGLVYGELSHPRLESWMRAPLHSRKLNINKDNEIGDEERYGAVRRFKNDTDFQPSVIKGDGNVGFKKEYYRDLKFLKKDQNSKSTGSRGTPKFLVKLQEGHVVDEVGDVITQDITDFPLRYLKELFTKNTDTESKLSVQVDDVGNTFVLLPEDATDGTRLKIPAGQFLAEVAKNWELHVGQTFKVDAQDTIEENSVGDTSHKAGGDYNIETSQSMNVDVSQTLTANVGINADIKAPLVNLGKFGLSGVITHNSHPSDYVTGWPILYSLTVQAAS